MKLRLPHLLRRLLTAAMTVTSVTVGTANSSYAADAMSPTTLNAGVNDTENTELQAYKLRMQGGASSSYTLSGEVSDLLEDETGTGETGVEGFESPLGDTGSASAAAFSLGDDAAAANAPLSELLPGEQGENLTTGETPSNVGQGGTTGSLDAPGVASVGADAAEASGTFALTRDASGLTELTWDGTGDSSTWGNGKFGTQNVTADNLAASHVTFDEGFSTNVTLTSDVTVGRMTISGGGYTFSGAGAGDAGNFLITTGSLSAVGGEEASTITNISVANSGSIIVNGTELTLVKLTPTNPSAPIQFSNGGKLTIGDRNTRYDVFSGSVTVSDESDAQLHLYTNATTTTGGRVHLLDETSSGTAHLDVYIHGNLELNLAGANDSTTVRDADLFMDANSTIFVRANAENLTPTSGNIVLNGEVSLNAADGVAVSRTKLTSDFVQADGATATLKKTGAGGITLSGDITLSGMKVEAGTLALSGNVTLSTLTQTGGTVYLKNNVDSKYGSGKQITTLTLGNGSDTAVQFYVHYNAAANETNGFNTTTIGTLKVDGAGRIGTERDGSCHQGVININSLQNATENAATLTLTNGSQISHITAINVNGGDFSGTLKIQGDVKGGTVRRLAVNLNDADVAEHAVIEFLNPITEVNSDNHIALGLGSSIVKVAGLNGSTTNAAQIQAYQIQANVNNDFTGNAGANIDYNGDGVVDAADAARTLVLNVTSATPLETNAIINGGISLVKKGDGSQTISGASTLGSVVVEAGVLALTDAGTTASGDITVSGGSLDFAGHYTLGKNQTLSVLTGTENAAQLGGLTLSGGDMVFDIKSLSLAASALSVGTVRRSEGITTQQVTLQNADYLLSGRYVLATGWAGAQDLSFSGNDLVNGTASFSVQDGKLVLDYTSSYYYKWEGTASSNWNTTDANWSLPSADAPTVFDPAKGAVFESDANVTVTEEVSVNKLIVRDDATVSITETAALRAQSIEVWEGATLAFETAKDGYSAANITGAGTVELKLTNDTNTLNLGADFTGETYVTAGKLGTANAQVGETLRLADRVDLVAQEGDFNADLVLEGETNIQANAPVKFNGTVTGGGTLTHSLNGYYEFHGVVDLHALKHDTNNEWGREMFFENATFDIVDLVGGQLGFQKDSTITTLRLQAATKFVGFGWTGEGDENSWGNESYRIATGTHTIGEATIAGGTVYFNGTTTIGSLAISGGTTTFANTADIGTFTISGGTVAATTSSFGQNGKSITLAGGTLDLKLATAQTNQTLLSALVVNNANGGTSYLKNSAGAETMKRTLTSVSIAAGNTLEVSQAEWNTFWYINDLSGAGNLTWNSDTTHYTASHMVFKGDGSDFTGTITLNRNKDVQERSHQAYMEIAENDAVKGATLALNGNSATSVASLAINAAQVTMQGLKGNEHAHLYAGAAPTGRGANNDDHSNVNHAVASSAANTLTITGAGTYTYAGTVGTADDTAHLNLAMTGAGSQTFSGEAHVGDVSVSNGTLALSNANSKVYGDITVSGGTLNFGGTYTLGTGQVLSVLTGTQNAVQLGGLALSGGQLTFDAASLTANTAALQVGTVGAGTGATVTLDFSGLTGALASGTYKLATGDWTNVENLTYRGASTGTFTASAEGLFLTYTNNGVYTWVAGAVDGEGAADSAWSSANWDLVPDADAGNNLSFATGKDAVFNTNAGVSVTDTVSAGTVYILNGAEVSLGMSGEGASFAANELIVANGKLTLGEQTNWTGIKDITVKDKGTLVVPWASGLTAESLLLQGGTIELRNGAGDPYHHHLDAAITVDGSGQIKGSYTGTATVIRGSITGTGELSFSRLTNPGQANPITIDATMTDGANGALSINIGNADVVYSNAKTYTGGTTIGAGGELNINVNMGSGGGALQGDIDVYGTLKLSGGDITGWSSTQGVKAINVYEDGTLNVATAQNQTGAGIAINLQGGTMTGSAGSNFDLGYGGSVYGNSAINAFAADDASAENMTVSSVDTVKLTLRQYTTAFYVDEFAQLNISSVIRDNDKSILNYETNPGASTFTKNGLGELVLSGNNTYTYATTVAAGTLTLAHAGALNSHVTVNAGALFRLEATSAKTFAKTISGAGTVEKTGAGVLTLTGAHTYTGDTTITGGTLQLANAATLASDVVVNSGATFELNANTQTMTFDHTISGAGGVKKSGSYDVTFTQDHSYTGATTIEAGKLILDTQGNYTLNGAVSGAGTLEVAKNTTLENNAKTISTALVLNGGQATITGGSTLSGDVTIKNGSTLTIATTNGSDHFKYDDSRKVKVETGGVLNIGSNRETFGGKTLDVAGGKVTGAGARGDVGTVALDFHADGTIMASAGNGLIEANMGVRSGKNVTFDVASGATLTISGTLCGAGSFKKDVVAGTGTGTGTGDLIFTTDHTYTGTTTINAGKLILDLGTVTTGEGEDAVTTNGIYTLDGAVSGTGILQVNTGTTLQVNKAAHTIGVDVVTQAGALLEIVVNGDYAMDHTISGDGGVKVDTEHTVTFTKAHTYLGGTTINGGTLQLANAATLASNVTVNEGATLDFYAWEQNMLFEQSISGAGKVTITALPQQGQISSNVVTFNKAHTYTGGTVVNSGTLRLTDGASLASGVELKNDSLMEFVAENEDMTFDHTISGVGKVKVDTEHKVTFTKAHTYLGGTVVSRGTLELAGEASLADVSGLWEQAEERNAMLSIEAGGTLLLNTTEAVTLHQLIMGSPTSDEEGEKVLTSFIHKTGEAHAVLSGLESVGRITVAGLDDGANANAGILSIVKANSYARELLVAHGAVHVGAEGQVKGNDVQVARLEMGACGAGETTSQLVVHEDSSLTVDESAHLATNAADTELTVKGALLAENAQLTMGAAKTTITIDGGTLAAQGMADMNPEQTGAGLDLTLTDNGKLILGAGGLSTEQTTDIQLDKGTVGMTADMTLAEDMTLTSAEGTTFDTSKYIYDRTPYDYDTNEGYRPIVQRVDEAGTMTVTGNISSAADVAAKMNVVGAGMLKLNGNAALSGGLEVEQGATLQVGEVFSMQFNKQRADATADASADATTAATVGGPVRITQATEGTAISGTNNTEKTRMEHSLITIAQRASLTVENMLVSDTSRITGTTDTPAVQTYATREGGSNIDVSQVKVVNTTIELSENNAQVAAGDDGSTTTSITLGQLQAVGTSDASGVLTLSGASNVMTVNSDALSNLLVLSESNFVVDFSYLLNAIQLKDVDFIYLDFDSVNYQNLAGSTISATMDGHTIQAYFAGTGATAGVPNVGVYFDVSAIPEPTTTTLSLLALAGLMVRRRRRK